MKISKSELIEMGACKSGLKRFIEQTGNADEQVEVSSLIGGVNTYEDLLWLAGKKVSKDKIARFAKNVALINIELIKPYISKYRYKKIIDFLKSDNNEIANAAWDAANTAADAADAADAAWDAAYAARYAAASAYAYTYAAYFSAAYAATYAAYAAFDKKQTNKLINQYLLELFYE